MAREIADVFIYDGKQPLDARKQFDTVSDMASYDERYLANGISTFCLEDQKMYQFKETNEVDPVLGKWREVVFGEYNGYYVDKKKIAPYAYEVWYNELNYDYAHEYFRNENSAVYSDYGCSAVRTGNLYGRNFDWLYDNTCEFVVHTKATGGRHATLGTATMFKQLIPEVVETNRYNPAYTAVPFGIVDGCNDAGLVMNTNVVPAKHDVGTYINPTGSVEVTLCSSMLVRFVLDHFSTAMEAYNYIRQHVRLYFPQRLTDKKFEPHFMIADKTITLIMECIDGGWVARLPILADEKNIMTNFHVYQVRFISSGKDLLYTPATQTASQTAVSFNKIEEYGVGLERYNLIANSYTDAATLPGMTKLLKDLRYTNTYTQDIADPKSWCTEYTDEHYGLTVESSFSAFDTIRNAGKTMYENRSRDEEDEHFGTWQTVHSVIYDLDTMKAHFMFQENDVIYSFDILENLFPKMVMNYYTEGDIKNV